MPKLLHEFHHHRLGATIEGVEYEEAEVDFFDDLVSGVAAREAELDAAIAARLAPDWPLHRLDRPMRQILRAGAYELAARIDVPTGSVISEYVDVAKAFYGQKEAGFVNGLLDAVAKDVRKIAAPLRAERSGIQLADSDAAPDPPPASSCPLLAMTIL